MGTFVEAIADIDTCNIHTLKSIAKSIKAEYVTEFIDENFPSELLNLINIFSIPKHHLVKSNNSIFHFTSILEMFGAIDKRNTTICPEKYKLSLFHEINDNLDFNVNETKGGSVNGNLFYLFEANKIPITRNTFDYSSEYNLSTIIKNISFNDEIKRSFFSIDKLFEVVRKNEKKELPIKFGNENTINIVPDHDLGEFGSLSLYKILQIAGTYFYKANLGDAESEKYLKIIDACLEPKSVITYNEEKWLNPFHIIISIIKLYIWNTYTNKNLNCIFENPLTNNIVNLYPLCIKIFQTIQFYDESYLNDFVTYHFYGLFFDKIVNADLRYEWNIDPNTYAKYYMSSFNEYTFDELYEIVKDYITLTDLTEMTSDMTTYNRYHVEFIQYLSILNNLLFTNENGTNENLIFKYDITKFNNDFPLDNIYNNEYRRLLGMQNDENEHTDLIRLVAKKFTDLSLKILYAREELKTLVQQYTLIRY